ncbi:uncharacterized protein A4U43_C06F520 [Asparagus officinalis]|uniref:Berberine/berberine-like domain-containing protein n=1 Tax=Asparagus officinalis TaxID=4686 RepID=A0A5P1EIG7_ASPOF|nr:berberine bridge enzyme-like 22 [Asparagus officinalis]ONK65748.1 uncharacterized protein A4U43_C06F520 [Asparagus officinalis]
MGEELFWAIRGGGAASFGVVTAFKIKLVDVPPVVTAFNVFRNLRQNATELVARWQEIAHKFDDNLFIRLVIQRTTDNGQPSIQVLFNSLFLGDKNQLLSVVATAFPELGLAASDCTEMNWLQQVLFFNSMPLNNPQALLTRTRSSNNSFKAKSDFVTTPINARNLEKIWKFIMAPQDQPLVLILEPFGGRMDQIPPSATPFPYRRGFLYNIQYDMNWADSSETQKHLQWMKDLYSFMTPFVTKNPRGAYYNYKDLDLGRNEDGEEASYEKARVWGEKYFGGNFKRLAIVKGKVDPQNFFRNEQSIPPLFA